MEQMKPLLCSCLREREMDRDVVNGGGRLRDGRRKQDMKRLWRKTDRKGVRDYKMERD